MMPPHDQAAPALSSWPTTFPTSVLLQEHRDDYKPLLHTCKEDNKPPQVHIFTCKEDNVMFNVLFYLFFLHYQFIYYLGNLKHKGNRYDLNL